MFIPKASLKHATTSTNIMYFMLISLEEFSSYWTWRLLACKGPEQRWGLGFIMFLNMVASTVYQVTLLAERVLRDANTSKKICETLQLICISRGFALHIY